MNIREIRANPELPNEYFELRAALEASVLREPLFERVANLAVFHAVCALERLLWQMRPIAELEVLTRLAMGISVEVGAFSMAIQGIGAGLTNVVRLLEQRGGPPVAVAPDPNVLSEAEAALRTVNGRTELYIVLGDVEMGWRSCVVEGRTIRVPSKSPERFVRSVQRSLRREGEQNAILIHRDDPRERAFYERLRDIAGQTTGWYAPSADLVGEAVETFGDSWRRYSDPRVRDTLSIQERCTVADYRRVCWALKAYAVVQQAVTDFQVPRPQPVPVRRSETEWRAFVVKCAGVAEGAADAVLDLLLHSGGRDLRAGGRNHAPIAFTPLVDCRDGTWVLAPTLAIWLDPELALRGMWKNRAPGDYNAKVAELNRELSEETGTLFARKGWVSIVERDIGVGDVDAGTGVREDPFFISGECKVFIDDPLRRADDPAVWEQLDCVVRRLRDQAAFEGLFARDGLAPGEVKGLVVVPGRAQTPADLGDDYALVGFDDLRDLTDASSAPRDLWQRIKAGESEYEIEVEEVAEEVDGWTIVSDGVRRAALLR